MNSPAHFSRPWRGGPGSAACHVLPGALFDVRRRAAASGLVRCQGPAVGKSPVLHQGQAHPRRKNITGHSEHRNVLQASAMLHFLPGSWPRRRSFKHRFTAQLHGCPGSGAAHGSHREVLFFEPGVLIEQLEGVHAGAAFLPQGTAHGVQFLLAFGERRQQGNGGIAVHVDDDGPVGA